MSQFSCTDQENNSTPCPVAELRSIYLFIYLVTLTVAWTIRCRMIELLMNNKHEKIRK